MNNLNFRFVKDVRTVWNTLSGIVRVCIHTYAHLDLRQLSWIGGGLLGRCLALLGRRRGGRPRFLLRLLGRHVLGDVNLLLEIMCQTFIRESTSCMCLGGKGRTTPPRKEEQNDNGKDRRFFFFFF